eukprot:2921103-Pleurochrysis_carterae.AAC.1
MASAMARSTARVKPSPWKDFLPGSVMPFSSPSAPRRKSCGWSAPGSFRPSRRTPRSGSAGLPAPVALWRPSGCGSTAPWPAGRPASAELGAPPSPACASSPPPERRPRCARRSGAAPAL